VFVEAVDAKRREFENRGNDHQAARDYINELRVYLENRLLNLFMCARRALNLRRRLVI